MTRFLVRLVFSIWGKKLVKVVGLERVAARQDPVILALNHNQALEVLLIPALLFFERGGKRVHFLADWNYRLIPLVDLFYRCGEVVTLTRKPAKPRFLDFMRPWFADKKTAHELTVDLLRRGHSVGVFPEGTINRGRQNLLKGYSGVARLSLETGCPVVPVGIQFPELTQDIKRVPEFSRMSIEFGDPLSPPSQAIRGEPTLEDIRDWHSVVMESIARLCGKQWDKRGARRPQEGLA